MEVSDLTGKVGEPREIVGAAVFLASGSSTFMSGQNLVIDGGSTIKDIL